MSEAPSILADIVSSVGASRTDRALDGAMRALQTKIAPIEVVRAAARGAALHHDVGLRRPPLGLVALAAATNLFTVLPAHLHPLPTLQALVLASSEKKADVAVRAPAIVRGEITHLGRSFLVATRDGNLPEAESIFLGILEEGAERRMAGDMLFRAAAEDMGHGGLKLVVAVKLWQLARALRFRDARVILRPAIQFLVAGERDSSSYRSMLDVLGKEWVDLETLATGGRPLDEAGRIELARALAAPDGPNCVAGTLAVLRDGYAPTSVAEAFSVEAARRILGATTQARDAIVAALFAHSSRFVLTFTRTPEKLYVLFQVALRLRSLPTAEPPREPPSKRNEAADLAEIARALESRKPDAASAHVRTYLRTAVSPGRLMEVLADHACRDSPAVNEGLNLLLADACVAETIATRTAEPAMALAKVVASSPADQTAYRTWAPLLAP